MIESLLPDDDWSPKIDCAQLRFFLDTPSFWALPDCLRNPAFQEPTACAANGSTILIKDSDS